MQFYPFLNALSFAPGLNEELVQLLLIRDELHTEQDAMLVDIEDLTRSVTPPPSQRRKEAQDGLTLKNWGESEPQRTSSPYFHE